MAMRSKLFIATSGFFDTMQRDFFRLYDMSAVLLSLLLPVLLLVVEVLVLERYHHHHHYCDLLLFSLLVQCPSQLAAYSTAFKFNQRDSTCSLRPMSELCSYGRPIINSFGTLRLIDLYPRYSDNEVTV